MCPLSLSSTLMSPDTLKTFTLDVVTCCGLVGSDQGLPLGPVRTYSVRTRNGCYMYMVPVSDLLVDQPDLDAPYHEHPSP